MSNKCLHILHLSRSLLLLKGSLLILMALAILLLVAQADQNNLGFMINATSSHQIDEVRLERSLADYSSLEITGISLQHNNSSGKNDCYLIFLGEKGEQNAGRFAAKDLLLCIKTFLIGLSLDNADFWVNLNPSEPNRIVDAQVGRTDAGRIMLEADYQMKKDFAGYLNPCQDKIGQDYWKNVSLKRDELAKVLAENYPNEIENQSDVLFRSAVRNWIVPSTINVSIGNDALYILNYSLNIEQEPADNYSTFILEDKNIKSISNSCLESLNGSARDYGNFAAKMQYKMILPKVANDVNAKEKYSDLRRVYKSLAIAQWYKNQTIQDLDPLNDWSGVENSSWSSQNIWRNYVLSFTEGDVNCWKTTNITAISNTMYNLTQNETYNITRETNYYISYNNTTVVRGYPPVMEFIDLVMPQRTHSLEPFINMGAPKYQSWLERSSVSNMSSEYYTIGGVDYSNILPSIRIAEDINPAIKETLLSMTTAKVYVTYPGFKPSSGEFGFVIVDQNKAGGLLRKTTEGTMSKETGDLYLLANTWYVALFRDWLV